MNSLHFCQESYVKPLETMYVSGRAISEKKNAMMNEMVARFKIQSTPQ